MKPLYNPYNHNDLRSVQLPIRPLAWAQRLQIGVWDLGLGFGSRIGGLGFRVWVQDLGTSRTKTPSALQKYRKRVYNIYISTKIHMCMFYRHVHVSKLKS